MPVLRVLLGMLVFAFVQPVFAVEFWAPADCELYMEDHVGNLEQYVEEMGEARVLLDAAQRNGDAATADHLEVVIESKRVDGIISVLKRIDTVEYIYCDKSLFDPALIARVDAVRPYAEATGTTVAEVEQAPKIVVTGITTTFVPYEMLEGGGCKGPFLDLSIDFANLGGVYPRPVDLDKTRREYPTANLKTQPLLTVSLFVDWGAGYGQVPFPLPWDAFEGENFPSGATMSVPYRLFVPSSEKSVKLGGGVSGAWLFVVNDTPAQAMTYETEVPIAMWDAYTQSVEVVSGPSRENKRETTAAVRATITNLGDAPFPGPLYGDFTITQGGSWIGTLSGKSLSAGAPILAGTTVRGVIKGKTFVDSSIGVLCPDGSFGTLSDGNPENNIRQLEGEG